jgi:cytochrome c oxidase cbb3-type subunit 3
MLDQIQVGNVATYVYSLSNPLASTPQTIARIEAGRQVFLTNCAACHGEDAKGNQDLGAPNLSDRFWIYGGDFEKIITTIHGGRQGHMHMGRAADPAEIKILRSMSIPGRRIHDGMNTMELSGRKDCGSAVVWC